MKFFQKRKREAAAKRLATTMDATFREAMRGGWDLVAETTKAIQAECGFPRAASESIYEYGARAAGVSVDAFERARQCAANAVPAPELKPAVDLLKRVGIRILLSKVPE
jgi:hypothetical protein